MIVLWETKVNLCTIREWIEEEQIELQYISTEEQLADILTKSLPYER